MNGIGKTVEMGPGQQRRGVKTKGWVTDRKLVLLQMATNMQDPASGSRTCDFSPVVVAAASSIHQGSPNIFRP